MTITATEEKEIIYAASSGLNLLDNVVKTTSYFGRLVLLLAPATTRCGRLATLCQLTTHMRPFIWGIIFIKTGHKMVNGTFTQAQTKERMAILTELLFEGCYISLSLCQVLRIVEPMSSTWVNKAIPLLDRPIYFTVAFLDALDVQEEVQILREKGISMNHAGKGMNSALDFVLMLLEGYGSMVAPLPFSWQGASHFVGMCSGIAGALGHGAHFFQVVR